jgi:pSer/pThr/pTyr-binding forkhead associated (FHA) protein
MGRAATVAQLVFDGEASNVSRRHCRIGFERETGSFKLEDLWSSNGTYVESGEKVEPTSPRTLRSRDQFFLGDREEIFEVALEGG